MNDHLNGGAAPGATLVETPQEPAELVGMEFGPIHDAGGNLIGLGLSLTSGEGEKALKITAGMGQINARALAAQILAGCDVLSKGSQRSLLVVTDAERWRTPGQALVTRMNPDGTFNHTFQIDNRKIIANKSALILPV